MKAVVAAFNQEKALVGAFSVIVQLHRLIVYTALIIPLSSVPRDVSFYLCAGFWAFYIFWRQEIRVADAAGFLVLYVLYIAVVVVGRWINNKHRADTHQTQSILTEVGTVTSFCVCLALHVTE